MYSPTGSPGRGRYVPGRGSSLCPASAGGWEGLQAGRSGGEGKVGDEAGKVSMHQTKEQRLQICI